ncbi:MAG: hypothetical protein HC874_07325 [Richelia sp. SL_2_1]|nr:hypothetical protein [Richelia sp. SL_2_1]
MEGIDQNSQEVYLISWKEVQGNPLLAKLNPDMLSPEGHIVTGLFKIKGKSKKVAYAANVSYDREYAIKYICSKLLQPLGITKFNEIQALIAEAWNEYKAEHKQ